MQAYLSDGLCIGDSRLLEGDFFDYGFYLTAFDQIEFAAAEQFFLQEGVDIGRYGTPFSLFTSTRAILGRSWL